AEVGDGGGGEGVAVGVDADDAVDELCQYGHRGGPPGVGAAVVGVGLGGVTARHNCDGSHPCRVGQAADQASVVGQADAGTPADSSDLKATRQGCQLHNESCRGASARA